VRHTAGVSDPFDLRRFVDAQAHTYDQYFDGIEDDATTSRL
jgi:uncharacterized protein (DUF1810 family)